MNVHAIAPALATPSLSPWLSNILEKKVNNLAMTCLEKFVHFFLVTFCCCSSYREMFLEMAPGKVHPFPDGTPLYDGFGGFHIFHKTGTFPRPGLNGKKIDFVLVGDMLWGRMGNTARIVVDPLPGNPEIARIREYELYKPTPNEWHVNPKLRFVRNKGEGLEVVSIPESLVPNAHFCGYVAVPPRA